LVLTSVDLEFMNARAFSVLEICRMFGMPPHKVAVVDRAASQNIPQQDQDYVNSTVSQDLERWEAKIQRTFDLDLENIHVDFDEAQLLRADILTRMNAMRLGVLTGILTPNEARRAEQLPPKEGADNLLVPANTAALGSDMTGTAPDAAGRPEGSTGGGHGVLPFPKVPTSGEQPDADDVAPAA
jgi:phage portal protein BeeE